MYATHHLRVIHPCAKYGKQMSNQKKLWARHESTQTDGRTEREQRDIVIPIYLPELHAMGGGGGEFKDKL